MKLYPSRTTIAVAFLVGSISGVTAGDGNDNLLGCYKSVNAFKDQGTYKYQSYGHCSGVCTGLKMAVMALHDRNVCLCGEKIPADSSKTDDDNCSVSCQGYPDDLCGSSDDYSIYLTGYKVKKDVKKEGDSPSSTSSTSAKSTVVQGGHTVVVTSSSESNSKSGGPNKAAIAAGVVVGVLVIGGLIGGAFFFLKYKKRQEVVEEYRRNATISNFVAGGKSYDGGSSTGDSRLDHSLMSQRRQSNGSIADDQDFSRRILKVTNPDGHY